MTEFDELSYDELKSLLRKNRDAQYEISNDIKRVSSYEEDYIRMLKEDYKAIELLSDGWTGEDMEKYTHRSIDENNASQMKFLHAFSQERDRLHYERKRLQMEEEEILFNLANVNSKEE